MRIRGERFFLTRKGGAGLIRQEEEYEISKEVFELLQVLTVDARIEKTRDEITGSSGKSTSFIRLGTSGLFLAELELPGESVTYETLPAIAGVTEKDITPDEMYKNKNLAINAAPRKK